MRHLELTEKIRRITHATSVRRREFAASRVTASWGVDSRKVR